MESADQQAGPLQAQVQPAAAEPTLESTQQYQQHRKMPSAEAKDALSSIKHYLSPSSPLQPSKKQRTSQPSSTSPGEFHPLLGAGLQCRK